MALRAAELNLRLTDASSPKDDRRPIESALQRSSIRISGSDIGNSSAPTMAGEMKSAVAATLSSSQGWQLLLEG